MHRARDIIGLPVIEIKTGKRHASVVDFLLDDQWNLQGILLDSKHWFANARYILWEDISAIGQDAVTISDESVIQLFDKESSLFTLLSGDDKIAGIPIMTKNGVQLGRIEDVYFKQKLGRKITGFELSDGLIADLQDGRKWLPMPYEITMGKDTIIVPVHCQNDLEKPLHSIEG